MVKKIKYLFWYINQLFHLLDAVLFLERKDFLLKDFKNLINQNAEILVNFKFLPKIKFKIRDFYDLLAFYEIFIEKPYQKLFSNYHGNGITFIDIGAYNGDSSLYASQFKFVKRIVSIEPHPGNFDMLVKNMELNRVKNIVLLNKAVGLGKKMKLFLHKNNRQTGMLKKKGKEKEIVVDCVSLEKLVDNYSGYLFIKCDAEGAEYEIFPKISVDCFSRVRRLVIEYHGKRKLEKLISTLKKFGMEVEVENNLFLDGLGYIYCFNNFTRAKL
jgi:FkbM family methyltransferase